VSYLLRHKEQGCEKQPKLSYLLKGKKMKKISIVILVVAMLALSVVPAFAAGGPPENRGTASGSCTGTPLGAAARNQANYGTGQQAGYGSRAPYALSGTISAIDPLGQTITVSVACGNWMVKSYIGSEVTLQTSSTTRFLLRNESGTATLLNFADLVVGQTVSSQGALVDGIFTASRVTMGALLTCLP
jgi:hypothetical protein